VAIAERMVLEKQITELILRAAMPYHSIVLK
jgi:hypothetical protein